LCAGGACCVCPAASSHGRICAVAWRSALLVAAAVSCQGSQRRWSLRLLETGVWAVQAGIHEDSGGFGGLWFCIACFAVLAGVTGGAGGKDVTCVCIAS
jgi:hypothetical protein